MKRFIEEDVQDIYEVMSELKKRGMLKQKVEIEDIQLFMTSNN